MPETEVKQLLHLTHNDVLRAVEVLEKQLNILYQRAQVLISLAGVTLTITGFSGRLIAATNRPAQVLIIAGLGLVLASAVWIYSRVMAIKWITSEVQPDSERFLAAVIRRRNQKTFAYSLGGKILLAGLFLYCLAFVIMLLNA